MVVYCVLAIITLALYWLVLHFEFINLDDPEYGSENHFIGEGVTRAGLIWAFTSIHVGNWHPLTTMSLMLTTQLFGAGAGGFHVVNLIFHVANSVLLFLLFRQMTGAFWRSALVAALFAWHPLHIESVA